MGNIPLTEPTQTQFAGVREICLHNSNGGAAAELFLQDYGSRDECGRQIAISVGETKCINLRNCGITDEGNDNLRVGVYAVAGGSSRFSTPLVYSAYGTKVTLEMTGSLVGNAAARFQEAEELPLDETNACLGESCYVIPHDRNSWQYAQNYCQRKGGHLASIESAEEHEFVLSMFREAIKTEERRDIYGNNGGNAAWIGLRLPPVGLRYTAEGIQEFYQFDPVWADGAGITYTNWAANQPSHTQIVGGLNAQKENAVELRKDTGEWDDIVEFTQRLYICEIPKNMIQQAAPFMES